MLLLLFDSKMNLLLTALFNAVVFKIICPRILIMTNKYSWQNWDQRKSPDNREIRIIEVWLYFVMLSILFLLSLWLLLLLMSHHYVMTICLNITIFGAFYSVQSVKATQETEDCLHVSMKSRITRTPDLPVCSWFFYRVHQWFDLFPKLPWMGGGHWSHRVLLKITRKTSTSLI